MKRILIITLCLMIAVSGALALSGCEQKCKTCDGKKIIQCPDCEGKGYVQRAIGSVCAYCVGTGEVNGRPCPDCDGEGMVYNRRTEKIECETCNSEGIINCPDCNADKE